MEKKKKITVLMAVYNAEKHLRKSLDSLLNQTHQNLQIICINDASTDDSLAILQAYAQKDKRILLLDLPQNGGQAQARNFGLKHAEGEYVAMLDADDWLANDSLEQVINIFAHHPQTDCVLLRLMQYFEATNQMLPFVNQTEKEVLTGEEALRLSLDWRIHGVYVVRTSIHQRYPFDASCKLFSDDNTTRIHFLHAREVRFSSGIYYYRKHEQSATNSITLARFDYLEANLSMKRQLEEERVTEELLNFYEHHRWLNLVGMYWFYHQHKSKFDKRERQQILTRIAAMLLTIEIHRIPYTQRCKLGYIPLKNFKLFCLQEQLYFALRSCLPNRLRNKKR